MCLCVPVYIFLSAPLLVDTDRIVVVALKAVPIDFGIWPICVHFTTDALLED